MVGKIRRVRQKLHQHAVRLLSAGSLPEGGAKLPGGGTGEATGPPSRAPVGGTGPPSRVPVGAAQAVTGSSPSPPPGVFAGTRISPEALVQTLTFDEGLQAHAAEAENQKKQPKRQRLKERRALWLHKVGSIVQTRERQRAEARRRATPVVGDMRPLADALPQLGLLMAPTAGPAHRRQSRKAKPVKRATPTDFSQMKPAVKRKLLEAERSLFSESLKTLSTKTNPLLDVGEQLRKMMRREEEQ